jgi:DNA-binding NtrC family response regulator
MEKKILLIDDVEYIGFILRKNLEKYDNLILQYMESGEKGSEALKNEKYDLLILDLSLYDKDGPEILEELKVQQNPIPTIVISANYQKIEDSKKYNALAYFKKPIDFDKLNETIEKALNL